MAYLDLLHEGTKSEREKSYKKQRTFNDAGKATGKEGDVMGLEREKNGTKGAFELDEETNMLRAKLRAFRDILCPNEDDRQRENKVVFSTDGAWGVALVLAEVDDLIGKLFDYAWTAEMKLRAMDENRKQAKEENCPEEKQEQADALAAGLVSAAAATENELPVDVSNDLFLQVGELSEAINIFSIIEDHHFTKLDSPVPCDEELERIGNLVKLATTKIILARNSIEDMIGDDGARQFGLTGRSAL